MTAEQEPQAEPAIEIPESVLVITFRGPGMAECKIEAENVLPAQVYTAAFILDAWARELRADQVVAMRQAADRHAPQLLIPTNRAARRHPVS